MHFYSYYSNDLCYDMLSGIHGAFRSIMCLVMSREYPGVVTNLVIRAHGLK